MPNSMNAALFLTTPMTPRWSGVMRLVQRVPSLVMSYLATGVLYLALAQAPVLSRSCMIHTVVRRVPAALPMATRFR